MKLNIEFHPTSLLYDDAYDVTFTLPEAAEPALVRMIEGFNPRRGSCPENTLKGHPVDVHDYDILNDTIINAVFVIDTVTVNLHRDETGDLAARLTFFRGAEDDAESVPSLAWFDAAAMIKTLAGDALRAAA